jgi:hypothetical protein
MSPQTNFVLIKGKAFGMIPLVPHHNAPLKKTPSFRKISDTKRT